MAGFTKKQREAMERAGPLPKTRKLGGRTFYLQETFRRKRDAQQLAETMRAEGHRVRMVTRKNKLHLQGNYQVYVG